MVTWLTMAQIAEMTQGTLKGDSGYRITGISTPEKGAENTISPLWEKKILSTLAPQAVLLTKKGWIPEGHSGIEVEEPRAALTTLLTFFEKSCVSVKSGPFTHSTAVVSENAIVGKDVYIGAGCVVEAAVIGDGAVLEANVFIGHGSSVGASSRLEPGVVVYHDVSIGSDCIIHANAVIGCDGFGFAPDREQGLIRIPQIGTVKICDRVEIGVCSSIDRATFGETVVGKGTKIDSHVKVGHNCTIGEFCVVVSLSGVAGSSKIGNGVTLGAQTGVANHATVGDGVIVAGRGGVTTDIEAGKTVSGFPARDHKEELRERVASRRLPEIAEKIKDMVRRINELEKKENNG